MRGMKTLILGVGGMLGHAMFRTFRDGEGFDVIGTARHDGVKRFFSKADADRLVTDVDVLDPDRMTFLFMEHRPAIVVNCVGLVKQLPSAKDPLVALPINSLFPHRLAHYCGLVGARLIHISTDCVFSGDKGNYVESDPADALDLYGRSKHLGETVNYPHAVTLRTSIIGHELSTSHSLIDWFLSQQDNVTGFSRAIFSGLPTNELARVIRDIVVPRADLCGLYHVSAAPIAKFDLLKLVADVYQKQIKIVPSDKLVIDRSLDSSRFSSAVGYVADTWPQLVRTMHDSYHRKGD